MEDELINLIKKKGLKFTRRTFKFNDLLTSENEDINTEINEKEFEKDCVLFSLQKWLREKHFIYVTPLPSYTDNSDNKKFFVEIFKGKKLKQLEGDYFDSYEKALERGLYEALQMI